MYAGTVGEDPPTPALQAIPRVIRKRRVLRGEGGDHAARTVASAFDDGRLALLVKAYSSAFGNADDTFLAATGDECESKCESECECE